MPAHADGFAAPLVRRPVLTGAAWTSGLARSRRTNSSRRGVSAGADARADGGSLRTSGGGPGGRGRIGGKTMVRFAPATDACASIPAMLRNQALPLRYQCIASPMTRRTRRPARIARAITPRPDRSDESRFLPPGRAAHAMAYARSSCAYRRSRPSSAVRCRPPKNRCPCADRGRTRAGRDPACSALGASMRRRISTSVREQPIREKKQHHSSPHARTSLEKRDP